MGKKKASKSRADGSSGDGKQQRPRSAAEKGETKKEAQSKQQQCGKQPQSGSSVESGGATQHQRPRKNEKHPQQTKKDEVQQAKQQLQQGQQKQQLLQQNYQLSWGQGQQHLRSQQSPSVQQQGWEQAQQRQQHPTGQQPLSSQKQSWGQSQQRQQQPPRQQFPSGQQQSWEQDQQRQQLPPNHQRSWGQRRGWGQSPQGQQPEHRAQPPPGFQPSLDQVPPGQQLHQWGKSPSGFEQGLGQSPKRQQPEKWGQVLPGSQQDPGRNLQRQQPQLAQQTKQQPQQEQQKQQQSQQGHLKKQQQPQPEHQKQQQTQQGHQSSCGQDQQFPQQPPSTQKHEWGQRQQQPQEQQFQSGQQQGREQVQQHPTGQQPLLSQKHGWGQGQQLQEQPQEQQLPLGQQQGGEQGQQRQQLSPGPQRSCGQRLGWGQSPQWQQPEHQGQPPPGFQPGAGQISLGQQSNQWGQPPPGFQQGRGLSPQMQQPEKWVQVLPGFQQDPERNPQRQQPQQAQQTKQQPRQEQQKQQQPRQGHLKQQQQPQQEHPKQQQTQQGHQSSRGQDQQFPQEPQPPGQQQGWSQGQKRQQQPQGHQSPSGQHQCWGQRLQSLSGQQQDWGPGQQWQQVPPDSQQGWGRGQSWGQTPQGQQPQQCGQPPLGFQQVPGQSPQGQQPQQRQQLPRGQQHPPFSQQQPSSGQQQNPSGQQQPPTGKQQDWGQGKQRKQPQQHQQQTRPPQGQQMQPQSTQTISSTPSQHSISSMERDLDTLSIASTSSLKSSMQRGPPNVQAQSSSGVASQYNVRSSPPDPKVAQWHGSAGTHHTIEANYVLLNLDEMPSTAYQYDVQFSLKRPTRFRPPAFEQYRRTILSRNRTGFPIAFDGKNIAYAAERIPSQGLGEFPVVFIDQDTGVEKDMKITIKEALDIEVDLTALQNYRHSGITEKPMRALQCLDVVLRTAPQDKSKLAGRAFYVPPKGFDDLGDGFELWRGLYQSLVLGDVPMMNIDVAHKGFPRGQSLLEVINVFPKGAANYIKNLRIIYEPPCVMNGNCKLFMANGLGDSANTQKFKDKSDEEMTIQQYFASKNVNLRHPDYPCISVGTVRKIYLPAEMCKIQAGQDVRKRAGQKQVRKLIELAATSTSDRKTKIMEIYTHFNYNQCEIVKGFNLQLSPDFIEIKARNIPPPFLRYTEGTVRPEKGSWRAANKTYLQSASMAKWGILVTTPISDGAVWNFAKMIIGQAQRNKMNIDQNYKKLTETNPKYLLNKFDEFKRDNCSIVFVISGSGNIYAQVKQKAELNYGILTQCVKAKTVEERMNMSTISNIFLKVNSKLNGINHKIEPSKEIAIMSNQKADVMFIGADVTHPSPDQSDIPSVAGVVGSYDQFGFRYRVCWRLQGAKVEMIADMQNITRELLTYFKEKRGKLPTHIIYYRDGVSDGQFAQLKSIELNAMNKACASMQSNYKPNITCLVVQKRHHTRFFPIDEKIIHPRDKYQNVMPGTVVDTTITHPGEKQFFLVSHESIQGTAKPAKYCIIRDDAEFGADELQALTYSMCHMFTRCNRSVSYPAPAYYAHLVAARGRVYIDGDSINRKQLDEEYKSRNFERISTSNPMFFV